MDLKGKVAIVTGGGSGIGREICLEFAARGAAVAVASNQQHEIEEVVATVSADAGIAMACHADVTDDADVAALIAATVDEYGRPDILVNAAALSQAAIAPGRAERVFESLSWDQWDRLMDVNLGGTVRCMLAVLPLMKSSGSGSIINFTSGTVRFPLAGISAYTTSKYAVEGLTKTTAIEFEPYGIRVNCLQPGGPTDTALIPDDFPAELRPGLHQPSVIRSSAAWLASDESRMMTGRSFVAMEWNKERGIVDCPCVNCSTRATTLALEWRGAVAL